MQRPDLPQRFHQGILVAAIEHAVDTDAVEAGVAQLKLHATVAVHFIHELWQRRFPEHQFPSRPAFGDSTVQRVLAPFAMRVDG